MGVFLYRAFGLTVASPIRLPELPEPHEEPYGELPELYAGLPDSPDVDIVYGRVRKPGSVSSVITSPVGNWWQAVPSDREILFGCDAGSFCITDGSLITVEPAPDASAEAIRLYLLGSALGAAQIQRGRIPLHGGAVITREPASGGDATVSRKRVAVLTGDQGAGKSTMTGALVHAGFKYLSDDVVTLSFDGNTPLAYPAYPQRKLDRGACARLGYNPETLPVVDAVRDKFAVRDRENWYGKAADIGILVELIPADSGEKLRAEPVTGHDCLRLLIRSLYRPWMHSRDGGLPAAEFKKMLTAAAAFTSYRVYVPRDLSKLTKYADELAATLNL